jgi:hypothetical protein
MPNTALLERPPATPRSLARDDKPLRFVILDGAGNEVMHADTQERLATLLWTVAYSDPYIRLLENYQILVQGRKKRPHHESSPRGPRPRRVQP